MIIRYATNGNKLVIPDIQKVGNSSTHYTESNYLDIFYGDFFKRDGSFTKKRKQHFYACNKLKNIIQSKIGNDYSYSELFGGIGLKAALFCDNMNSSKIQINELSDKCCDVLKDNFKNAKITCSNSFDFVFNKNYDVSVIDFNNYTLKKYSSGWKTVIDNIFSHTNKFIVLNDCSITYLNKGGRQALKTYSEILGVNVNSVDEYRKELNKFYIKNYPEWRMRVVCCCGQTDFILFEKSSDEENIDIERITKVDIDAEQPIIYVEDEDLFGGMLNELYTKKNHKS